MAEDGPAKAGHYERQGHDGPPEGGHHEWRGRDGRDGPPEGGHYERHGPAKAGHYEWHGRHGPAQGGHYERHEWHGHYIYALKQDLSRTRTTTREGAPDAEDLFSRIRCPLCAWRPSPSSRWSCVWTAGNPEPAFPSCGAIWNTFATRGSCPGCRHQWRWTSCLRCAGWSPHDDWYEEAPA